MIYRVVTLVTTLRPNLIFFFSHSSPSLPQSPKHREVRRLQIEAGVLDPDHGPGWRHQAAVLLLAAMDLLPYDLQEGEADLGQLGLLRVVQNNELETSS